MISGLIISKDHILIDELMSCMSASVYNQQIVDSIENMLELIDSESPDYIILADTNIDELVEYLEKLQDLNTENMPVILCFTAISEWQNQRVLWELGAFDVVQLPVSKEELNLYFKRFADLFGFEFDSVIDGLFGKLEEINLIELFHSFYDSKKTGELSIKSGVRKGKIIFKNGKIFSSEYKGFDDVASVLQIVCWLRGEFKMIFSDEDYENKIELDYQQLIMEAIDRLDRRASLLKQLPPLEVKLLISPGIDLNEVEADLHRYLKYFQGGKSIEIYLNEVDEDVFILLEKAVELVDKKMLLTKDEFNDYTLEFDFEEEDKLIPGVIKRIFSKEEDKEKKTAAEEKEEEKPVLKVDNERQMIESLFAMDQSELNTYKKKLERL